MNTGLNIISIRLIVTLFFGLLGTTKGFAQVQIAPVALYMNEDNQTGRIVVRNSSDQPVELNSAIHFGYPATNSQGKTYLKLIEAVPSGEPSAAEWIRMYPRHLILPPGEQQTIRFAIRPPRNLPDGEYWARPAIVANPLEPVRSQTTQTISTHINIIKRTFLSINYRQGQVKTGISVQNIDVLQIGDTLHLTTGLKRKGNAAYLGHIAIHILDAADNVRKHLRKEIAVYHELNPVFPFDVSDLSPGSYSVRVTLETGSRAERNSAILNVPPVSKTRTFTID